MTRLIASIVLTAPLALAALTACGDDEAFVLVGEGSTDSAGTAGADACLAPDGFAAAPSSIPEFVAFLNAMPKPVELPCFLEALPRPMKLHASRSVFSAQPANGSRSPRMFIFGEGLIMSVVPEGIGSHLVELGEARSETRSLKGEIEFPVEDELEAAAPYDGLLFNEDVTGCGFCHSAEEPATDIDFTRAFVSNALRPMDSQRVTLQSLIAEQRDCDAELEPERCAMLEALFSEGEVIETEFSTAFDTFF